MVVRAFAQEQDFFKEGKDLFSLCEYQKAITKFKAAKIKARYANIDTAEVQNWIDKSNNCIYLSKEGDSLFQRKNYELSEEIYRKIQYINPPCGEVNNRLNEIGEKLNCFDKNIERGKEEFKKGEYGTAQAIFNLAKDCPALHNLPELDSLIRISDLCSFEKHLADSLYSKGLLIESLEHFTVASSKNPVDPYLSNIIAKIKNEINNDSINKIIPKSIFIDYSFQSLCPYGISIGYFYKLGLLLSFRFDASDYDFQYSAILGFYTKILKWNNNIIYTTAGIGYGKYADYWFEKGEKLHREKYPGGFQFEPDLIFKTKNINIGLGWILPVFKIEYNSVTLKIGYNVNLKGKGK